MRIQSGETIAGQPVLAIRKLMLHGRAFGPTTSGNTMETITNVLGIDLDTAKLVYQELCEEGYIELATQHSGSRGEDEHWYTTIKGNALANASARKPITRRTASKQLEQFLQRVKQINAGEYAYQVKQVILFGSYLSDSLTLGDVDLSITLERRYEHDMQAQQDREKKRIDAAQQQGRVFKSSMDALFWPYQEVWLILKGRSPSLSLHDEHREQILSKPLPSEVLFDMADGENSISSPTRASPSEE